MKLKFLSLSRPTDITLKDWNCWGWQLKNSKKIFADLNGSGSKSDFGFQVRVTPYYHALAEFSMAIDKNSSPQDDPIGRLYYPQSLEKVTGKQEMLDPLDELAHSPVPGIVHRYPDRALLLVTDTCSVYCRFCTRKHYTGKDQAMIKKDHLANALTYLKNHPEICEVILSGGDPLTLGDNQLVQILSEIRKIDHIEIIRIGTRMPVVCPMRITRDLVEAIREYGPIFIMTHFNHPRELTEDAAYALGLFVDHGVPVFNQMVLLKGVNNDPEVVRELSRKLLYLRVKPYYMFQCDPSQGTDHLRTSVDESKAIQKSLWGNLSGLAMPNLALDIPGGGGKVPLFPNFEVSKDPGKTKYIGWDGIPGEYIDPE